MTDTIRPVPSAWLRDREAVRFGDDIRAKAALKPAGVAPLGLTAAASYSPAQVQALADKLDELLTALKR